MEIELDYSLRICLCFVSGIQTASVIVLPRISYSANDIARYSSMSRSLRNKKGNNGEYRRGKHLINVECNTREMQS